MKAIILAAGRGSRMNDLTLSKPKCLVEVAGTSLLDRQLKALRGAGVEEIGVVTGYRREMLSQRGFAEFFNPHWATTQMVTSLMYADDWLESETCIVSYSDIFYDAQPVRDLITCTENLALTYDPDWRDLWEKRFTDPLLDAEKFQLNGDHTLADIGGSPKTVDEIQGQFMGLLRFTPVGWEAFKRVFISAGENADLLDMTSALKLLLNEGDLPIKAVRYTGSYWGEVDSSQDLAVYESQLGTPSL